MLQCIDHILMGVPNLIRAQSQLRQLGFNVSDALMGSPDGLQKASAFNEKDSIQLCAIGKEKPFMQNESVVGEDFTAFIAAGGGIRAVAIVSDDLDADVAAMRARDVEVLPIIQATKPLANAKGVPVRIALLGPANRLPLYFIEYPNLPQALGPDEAGLLAHPNAVYTLERTYIVTDHLHENVLIYARVLGLPPPSIVKGTVIMSDMAVFDLGGMGLGIVQPYAEGPALQALTARGPGPFQALYRTRSMDQARLWMKDQGVPSLPCGVRNTGEVAMLAPPELAAGAYIGFVGMA